MGEFRLGEEGPVYLRVSVSIPKRDLGEFRQSCGLRVAGRKNLVSIPKRDLGEFRLTSADRHSPLRLKFQSLKGIWVNFDMILPRPSLMRLRFQSLKGIWVNFDNDRPRYSERPIKFQSLKGIWVNFDIYKMRSLFSHSPVSIPKRDLGEFRHSVDLARRTN